MCTCTVHQTSAVVRRLSCRHSHFRFVSFSRQQSLCSLRDDRSAAVTWSVQEESPVLSPVEEEAEEVD